MNKPDATSTDDQARTSEDADQTERGSDRHSRQKQAEEAVDAFHDTLITGSEQWWHFLDRAEAPEPSDSGAAGDSLELQDVNPQSSGLRPSSRSFRCRRCGGDNPADMTFCVFCGAPPSERLGPRSTLFIVSEVADETQKRRLSNILAAAHRNLDATELHEVLDDPPSFFFVDGPPSQLESVMERLEDFGVEARAVPPGEVSMAWYREVTESCLRDPGQTTLFGGTAGVAVLLAVMVSSWLLLPGFLAMYGLGRKRKEWYVDRFRFPADALLNAFAGLDEQLVARARDLLGDLHGDEAREYLTVALMEFYAIWHRLESRDASRHHLLGRLRRMLGDLIRHAVRICERYADLRVYLNEHDPAALEDQVRTLSAKSDPSPMDERELRERKQQLATARKIEATLEKLRGKLRTMAASVESLRARTVSMTPQLEAPGLDSPSMEVILGEIEDEMEVVDETLAEMPAVQESW